MSSDTLRISYQPQPDSASPAGEATPKPPQRSARLRHRLETYRGDGFRCVYCGKDLLADSDSLLLATVDHIVPRSAGGGNGQDTRTLAGQALQLTLSDDCAQGVPSSNQAEDGG